MRRKSFLLGFGMLVLLAGGAAGVLALLWWHEPDFYRNVAVPPGPQRQQQSKEFQSRFVSLINGMIRHENDTFHEQFTDQQINSYFDEDFLITHLDRSVLPADISRPRVAIEPNKIRLAFLYGREPWSTVVSIELHAWLTKEPNLMALEIEGLRAGSLPIGAQSLLESVAEAARPHDIEVTWYRHKGNPVALLRFQASKATPTVHLERLELRQGTIVIGGRSMERFPLRAMLNPSTLKPAAN